MSNAPVKPATLGILAGSGNLPARVAEAAISAGLFLLGLDPDNP